VLNRELEQKESCVEVETQSLYFARTRTTKKSIFTVMAPNRCGVGAKCTVLKKYLHPAKSIADRWPNRSEKDWLGDLLAIRQEIKKIKGQDQVAIVFHHDDLPDVEVYAVKRWVKVDNKGDSSQYFDQGTRGNQETEEDLTGDDVEREVTHFVLQDLQNATRTAENM